MLHRSKFFDNFGQFISKFPEVDLNDFFSKGQMESKRWLVNELINLDLDLGTIFLCAGWYGSLATFMFEANLKIKTIRSFDIDPSCAAIAETFNKSWVMDNWQFKASTLDITKITYPTKHTTYRSNGTSLELIEMPDTIINTSCEHINEFDKWFTRLPKKRLIVLQTNNYFDLSEHINCSSSLEEFAKQTPMETVLFEGELELPKYKRFMRIGTK
jgi:hypothetical protein